MDISEQDRRNVQFYEMRPYAPWGDYGNALIHGQEAVLYQPENEFHLNRAGPISIPVAMASYGELVVVDEVRDVMLRELSVTDFVPVVLDTVIHIDWDRWEPDESPDILPPSGEPEGYYTDFEHDPSILSEMDVLWHPQLVIGATGANVFQDSFDINCLFKERTESDWRIDSSSWNGVHLFKVDEYSPTFITDYGKKVLSKYTGDWIRFLPTKQ